MFCIKRDISIAIVCGFIVTLLVAFYKAADYSDRISEEISAAIMRFHVLANSDSPQDQTIKLSVRDGVLNELAKNFDGEESLEETRAALSGMLTEIERIAEEIVKKYGVEYSVRAYITTCYFPSRRYGEISLPAGNYETLRVEIGEGTGRNWWCVMFPPLCLVDFAADFCYEESRPDNLDKILAAETREVISNTENIKIKFKIVELWQEFKNFLFKS